MSDRIAVMSRGRYLQIDTPNRLYEAPTTREVAAFIGNMNFFDAKVKKVNGKSATVDAGALGDVEASTGDGTYQSGENVLLAIRPEKLVIEDKKPARGRRAVEGTLDNAAYLGERSHFYVRVEGIEKPVAVSAQNANRVLEDVSGEPRPVWLSWPEDAVIVLAAQ
ncbi:MAG: TOBE domain-containing protein, partial [Pseudomonadota bacterium]